MITEFETLFTGFPELKKVVITEMMTAVSADFENMGDYELPDQETIANIFENKPVTNEQLDSVLESMFGDDHRIEFELDFDDMRCLSKLLQYALDFKDDDSYDNLLGWIG